MATQLLQCSICPKHPNFSDTSHLLTHVGSKGHLAHLHRLQVRSHQEIAAGHQLALYNQWYQQHGLGQLLSERMQQKESKNAIKRERATTQAPTYVKQEHLPFAQQPLDPALVSPLTVAPPPRRRRNGVSKCTKRQVILDEDSDYSSSPIRRNRKRKGRKLRSSPIKQLSSENDPDSSDTDCPAEDDPQLPATPDNAKLKGVIWPGMDLFDAATLEMRRKRNQKKDGSVLRKMHRNSMMIEPTEVIYSPNGEDILKERLIDGMVDESSPLRGETPVPKPAPRRRRRQPLADVSANIPRTNRRTAKPRKASTSSARLPTPALQPPFQRLSSSSTRASFEAVSRFSPTEDESMEFKLTVGNLATRKRPGNFTIFNDDEANQPQRLPVSTNLSGQSIALPRNPFAVPPGPPARAHLSLMAPPWLQPQYQQNLQYSNGFISYRPGMPASKTLPEVGVGKENIAWHGQNAYGLAGMQANPLGWSQAMNQNPFAAAQNPFASMYTSQVGGSDFSRLGKVDDPFTYNRNPLSMAVGQFDGSQESAFGEMEQRPISPDGTVSDHENNDYEHTVFTINE